MRQHPTNGGFALIIALSLMAFVLVLLLSISVLTQVESRSSKNALLQTKARANAMLGMQIALGQLQKHAGADQRVTAPATVHYPDKDTMRTTLKANARDVDGFKTILSQSGRQNFEQALKNFWSDKNPRMTGVWDTRKTNGAHDRDQLPAWLISGNEKFELNAGDSTYPNGYQTPLTSIPDPETNQSSVWLVHYGSAGQAADGSKSDVATTADTMEGAVKAQRQAIKNNNTEVGGYAYWVADESQKANFTIRDPFYQETDRASEDYRNRLQAPQRVGWENITGFNEAFANSNLNDPNDERLGRLLSSDQIPLLDADLEDTQRSLFHDITTVSESIFTDTARGGLKKDLTAYFNGSDGPSNNTPIPNPNDYSDYGDWFGSNNQGFPNSTRNIPTWGQLKAWYDNEVGNLGDSSTVNLSKDVGPVITGIRLHVGFSKDADSIRFHLMPVITLWNPYDAGLSSQTYTIEFDYETILNDFTVTVQNDDTDPSLPPAFVGIAELGTSAYSERIEDSTLLSEDTTIRLQLTTGFKKGELKVFSIGSPHPDLLEIGKSTYEINLENVFDTDYPYSASFKCYDLDPSTYNQGKELRFVASGINLPPNIREITLSSGPFESVYTNYGTTSEGVVRGTVERNDYPVPSGLTYNQKIELLAQAEARHTNGRILHQSHGGGPDSFTAHIRGDSDVMDAEYPAFSILENTMLPVGHFRHYELRSPITISQRLRVFSNFNLGAKNFGVHPEIEATRGLHMSHNVDGYPNLHFASDLVKSNASLNVWDREQAEERDGSTRGFGLITPLYNDGDFRGLDEVPLRSVKRPKFKLLSLGQLQQVNVAPFFWQPGFTIGNSDANSYVDREAIAGITSREIGVGGYQMPTVQRHETIPNGPDNYTIDLSYLLNDALWDRYFLSGIPQNSTAAHEIITGQSSAPNSRIRVRGSVSDPSDILGFDKAAHELVFRGALNVNSTSKEAWVGLLTAFRNLQISQAGTSSEINPQETVPISRTFEPQQGVIDFAFDQTNDGSDIQPSSSIETADFGAVASQRDLTKVLGGFRYLTDDMIDVLAERIVDEVKLRGPFLSLADFVNRRLVSPDRASGKWESLRKYSVKNSVSDYEPEGYLSADNYDPMVGIDGINGALQRAINTSGINGGINHPAPPSTNQASLYERDVAYGTYEGSWYYSPTANNYTHNYKFSFFSSAGYYLDTEHLAGRPAGENSQLLSHSAGFVTQGDLLSMIGSALTARGDTFLIRSYGDSINPATGAREAKVWLETVVQRIPDPVIDTNNDMEPDDDFGRKFVIKSMRWLGENEI